MPRAPDPFCRKIQELKADLDSLLLKYLECRAELSQAEYSSAELYRLHEEVDNFPRKLAGVEKRTAALVENRLDMEWSHKLALLQKEMDNQKALYEERLKAWAGKDCS